MTHDAMAHDTCGAAQPEREIRTLGAGAFFGERALLRSEPRSANVIATSTVSTMVSHCHILSVSAVCHGEPARDLPSASSHTVPHHHTLPPSHASLIITLCSHHTPAAIAPCCHRTLLSHCLSHLRVLFALRGPVCCIMCCPPIEHNSQVQDAGHMTHDA